MKKYINIAVIAILMILLPGFSIENNIIEEAPAVADETAEIQWKSFESSIDLKSTGKKYFIYVYTDWCSWCKRMKSTTFKDEKVVKILNEKFVSVMFNAESKDPVNFRGTEFKFVSQGSRGYHELAAALLNNKLSYPSVVFLDEEMNMIQPLPGFKSAEDLSIILTYLGDEIYEEMEFQEYYNQQTEG
jgi:thioredoxin-related protein